MYRPLDEAAAAQVRASSKVYMELPRNNEWKVGLDRFLPDEGTMRISIRAARSTEELKETPACGWDSARTRAIMRISQT